MCMLHTQHPQQVTKHEIQTKTQNQREYVKISHHEAKTKCVYKSSYHYPVESLCSPNHQQGLHNAMEYSPESWPCCSGERRILPLL